MRGDPATAGHRPAGDRDEDAARPLPHVLHHVPVAHAVERIGDVFVRIAGEGADAAAIFEQLAQHGAGLRDLGCQPVHLDVALVAEDQTRRGVEHAEAFRHVVERGEQPGILAAGAVVKDESDEGRAKAGRRHGEQRPIQCCEEIGRGARHLRSDLGEEQQRYGPKGLL